jgi:hypothetical protein
VSTWRDVAGQRARALRKLREIKRDDAKLPRSRWRNLPPVRGRSAGLPRVLKGSPRLSEAIHLRTSRVGPAANSLRSIACPWHRIFPRSKPMTVLRERPIHRLSTATRRSRVSNVPASTRNLRLAPAVSSPCGEAEAALPSGKVRAPGGYGPGSLLRSPATRPTTGIIFQPSHAGQRPVQLCLPPSEQR